MHFFLGKLFYKSNKKLFSCVCIAWYKHERGWENSWQLCKPLTLSRVCITVSNSPNPSRVYIRLYKHGKHFLLLWLWGKYRVRMYLESPWKSLLEFKNKNRLEGPWKLQPGLESPWISVFTLSNPANTKKPSGWNCSCCWRTKKRLYRLKALFCSEWSPWPVGNVLETPWKVLEFFVQNRIHANLENSKFASTFLYLLIYNIIIFTLMLILL